MGCLPGASLSVSPTGQASCAYPDGTATLPFCPNGTEADAAANDKTCRWAQGPGAWGAGPQSWAAGARPEPHRPALMAAAGDAPMGLGAHDVETCRRALGGGGRASTLPAPARPPHRTGPGRAGRLAAGSRTRCACPGTWGRA
jgi:hypothetical protein